MKKLAIAVLAGLISMSSFADEAKEKAVGGTVSFYPQKILIKKNTFQGWIEFTNNSESTLKYQVQAVKWEAGNKYTETEEVSATPFIFTLKPHSSNKIRVINKGPSIDVERTYRLNVQQLDLSANQLGQNLSFPVFIAPVLAEPKALTYKQSADDVTVTNDGNVTQLLTKVVTNKGDLTTGIYVLPKSTVSLSLKDMGASKSTATGIEASLITEMGLKKF